MKSVIIDTNIIVSALISKGYPFQILHNIIFSKKVITHISSPIFKEYVDVLNRDKFKKIPKFFLNSQIVLKQLYNLSINFEPNIKVDLLSDKSDNKFLELAIYSKADYLITGNTRDFTIDKFGKTKILTPTEFWNHFEIDDKIIL